MRKLIYALTIISVIGFISCNKTEEEKQKEAAEQTKESGKKEADRTQKAVENEVKKSEEEGTAKATEEKEEKKGLGDKVNKTVTDLIDGVPKFESAEVNAFAKEYANYATNYLKAAKDKNTSLLSKLAAEGKELKKEAQSVKTRLQEGEVKKFERFLNRQTKKLNKASKLLAE